MPTTRHLRTLRLVAAAAAAKLDPDLWIELASARVSTPAKAMRQDPAYRQGLARFRHAVTALAKELDPSFSTHSISGAIETAYAGIIERKATILRGGVGYRQRRIDDENS